MVQYVLLGIIKIQQIKVYVNLAQEDIINQNQVNKNAEDAPVECIKIKQDKLVVIIVNQEHISQMKVSQVV